MKHASYLLILEEFGTKILKKYLCRNSFGLHSSGGTQM